MKSITNTTSSYVELYQIFFIFKETTLNIATNKFTLFVIILSIFRFPNHSNGLKMGSSKHWSKALEAMTGDTELNANAILEYFKPLHDFLNKENKRLATEDEVRQIFKKYNAEAAIYANRLTNADWDKTTDLNNKTKEDIYTELIAENANFTKEQYNLHFRNLKPDDFADEKIRRQIKRVTNLGTFKLDEGRLREFTETVNEMVKIYNKATFCSYFEPNCTKELTLDPGKIFMPMSKPISKPFR